jgi:hypothetical protein
MSSPAVLPITRRPNTPFADHVEESKRSTSQMSTGREERGESRVENGESGEMRGESRKENGGERERGRGKANRRKRERGESREEREMRTEIGTFSRRFLPVNTSAQWLFAIGAEPNG